MKVALFGGSFNPIHNDHVRIIKKIIEKNLADEVWVIPCKNHAFDKSLADVKHRVAMICLALKDIKKASICNIELEAEGKSYTIDTVQNLKIRYPHEFFWVIGSDILKDITKWNDYRQLFKEIRFIVFKRKGYPIKEVEGMSIESCIDEKEEDVSSTDVREKARNGEYFGDMVPKEVKDYIINEKLYCKV